MAPVFYEGELVGFSANTAHHVDIGAATPGLIIDVPDVFAEGMLFKGVKLYEGGVLDRALWQFIETNTRVPSQVMGDIEAQIASAELGVKRFVELLDQHGKDVVFAATEQLMDYSERMLRHQIAAIPDGEYRAEGFLDDDGRNRKEPLPVKVAVRIEGDSAEVDLTGSSPQAPTAFNVPFEGSTKVACYFAFRALLLDTATISEHVPQNEGSFRPIKVTAPKGTIFNPEYPAAAEARFNQIQRVGRLHRQGAGPGDPGEGDCGLVRRRLGHRLFRRAPRRPVLGLHRGQRGRLRRAPPFRRAGHDRGADAQHAQQPDRGPRHAPAAALRPPRAARRCDAGPPGATAAASA